MDHRLAALALDDILAAAAPFGTERTLPGGAYTSAEVFDWEMEHLWEGGWVALGRAEDFAGGAREARAGRESLIVTEDGGVRRGFFNVCRHRGHELLARGGASPRRRVTCPYHGWVYVLDGALRAAPKTSHRDDLGDVELVGVRLAEWHGWLFAAIDDATAPLDAYLGSLDSLVRPYDPAALAVAVRRSYRLAANWKLIHENYHECYHCRSIHPQLVAVADPDSGDNVQPDGHWVGGTMRLLPGMESVSSDGRLTGPPLPGLAGDADERALYVGVVPNLLISCHPDYVLTHRLTALAPDETLVECEWLYPKDAAAAAGFDPTPAVELWDVTNRQDWAACEALQRGASSRGHRPGYLGEGEDAVHHFQTLIARAYLR